jgi:hypothetical protein
MRGLPDQHRTVTEVPRNSGHPPAPCTSFAGITPRYGDYYPRRQTRFRWYQTGRSSCAVACGIGSRSTNKRRTRRRPRGQTKGERPREAVHPANAHIAAVRHSTRPLPSGHYVRVRGSAGHDSTTRVAPRPAGDRTPNRCAQWADSWRYLPGAPGSTGGKPNDTNPVVSPNHASADICGPSSVRTSKPYGRATSAESAWK